MLTEAALNDPDSDANFKKGLLIFKTARNIKSKISVVLHALSEKKIPDEKLEGTLEYFVLVESGINTFLQNNNFTEE